MMMRKEVTMADRAAFGSDSGRVVRWRARLREVGRVYRQIVGIPDYEGYLAHMAAHHPGDLALSRRDFCARAIDRRYGRSGPRCC